MKLRYVSFRLGLSLLGLYGIALVAQADQVKGEQLFKRQCAVCHSVQPEQTLMGPSLAGVIGRTAGTMDSFRYSPGMKTSGIVWSEEAISAFIESPRKLIPRTNMAFPGERDPAKRAAIVEYLASIQ